VAILAATHRGDRRRLGSPLGDEHRDRVAARNRQHAPVPRRAQHLHRAAELEAGDTNNHPKPRGQPQLVAQRADPHPELPRRGRRLD
jgi:hypothetical protein